MTQEVASEEEETQEVEMTKEEGSGSSEED